MLLDFIPMFINYTELNLHQPDTDAESELFDTMFLHNVFSSPTLPWLDPQIPTYPS